ncbi:MAG: hypothetical protein WCJ09_15300, partial [Planctomycetota bacterium]
TCYLCPRTTVTLVPGPKRTKPGHPAVMGCCHSIIVAGWPELDQREGPETEGTFKLSGPSASLLTLPPRR